MLWGFCKKNSPLKNRFTYPRRFIARSLAEMVKTFKISCTDTMSPLGSRPRSNGPSLGATKKTRIMSSSLHRPRMLQSLRRSRTSSWTMCPKKLAIMHHIKFSKSLGVSMRRSKLVRSFSSVRKSMELRFDSCHGREDQTVWKYTLPLHSSQRLNLSSGLSFPSNDYPSFEATFIRPTCIVGQVVYRVSWIAQPRPSRRVEPAGTIV